MTAIADFPLSAQSTDDVFTEHSVCPYCYCPVVTAGRGWIHSDSGRWTCEGGRNLATEWTTKTPDSAAEESYADGEQQGRSDGYDEGVEDGRRDGYDEGYDNGVEKGRRDVTRAVETAMTEFLRGLTPEQRKSCDLLIEIVSCALDSV